MTATADSAVNGSESKRGKTALPVYLDYNATSPVAPRVLTAMMPYFARKYGNASSSHSFGVEAHRALDEARSRVASLLNCLEDEVVFTGGGSEANNLAIKGVVMRYPPDAVHIITSVVDHPSVLRTCYGLAQRMRVRVTLLPVDQFGMVDPQDVSRAMGPQTKLVSIMLANNEVGTIQPMAEMVAAARAQSPDVLVHCDGAQAAGKIKVDVDALGVDMLTIAAHKFCGPKGVGALYVRRGVELDPLIEGAGHEQGRRSGTENIPGIVGMGMAAQLARHGFTDEPRRVASLRDRLQSILLQNHPSAVVHGHPQRRLPNTLNIAFPGLIGNDILAVAPGIAASTGAACHAGSVEPSSVLTAMGVAPEIARGALRLSIGRFTTEDQIDRAAAEISRAIRSISGSRRFSKPKLPSKKSRRKQAAAVS